MRKQNKSCKLIGGHLNLSFSGMISHTFIPSNHTTQAATLYICNLKPPTSWATSLRDIVVDLAEGTGKCWHSDVTSSACEGGSWILPGPPPHPHQPRSGPYGKCQKETGNPPSCIPDSADFLNTWENKSEAITCNSKTILTWREEL